MAAEPLIHWPDPAFELVGFVAGFLAAGAVGFRFTALRAAEGAAQPAERPALKQAAAVAAQIGIVGVLIAAGLFVQRLPGMAAQKHLTVAALIMGDPKLLTTIAFVAANLLGFVFARARVAAGWWVSLLCVLIGPVREVFFGGPLDELVNSLHRLAGGLWIGTLFVLVTAGLRPLLASALPAERRAALAKTMVDAFSPLALGGFALLGIMGVITAWTNLKKLDALWTTPFGSALIVKLVIVAGVVTLGAVNWKKQKPKMGTLEGAQMLRRSAELELWFATAVLLVTSILVSLPGPGE